MARERAQQMEFRQPNSSRGKRKDMVSWVREQREERRAKGRRDGGNTDV